MDISGFISDFAIWIISGMGIALAGWLRTVWVNMRKEYEESRREYAQNQSEMSTMRITQKVLTDKIEDQASLIAYFQEQHKDLIKQQTELQAEHNRKIDRLITLDTSVVEIASARDKFEADLVKAKKEVEALSGELSKTRAVLTESEREVYRYQGHQRAVKENFDELKSLLTALAKALNIRVDLPTDPDKPPGGDGPGGGGKPDNEKVTDIVDAIGKPLPSKKDEKAA